MLNPYWHAHLLPGALVELSTLTYLEIAQEIFILSNVTLNFDRLTFQLSNVEVQLGNLNDIALSTLLSSPFGSV